MWNIQRYSCYLHVHIYIAHTNRESINPWLRLYNYVAGITGEMCLKLYDSKIVKIREDTTCMYVQHDKLGTWDMQSTLTHKSSLFFSEKSKLPLVWALNPWLMCVHIHCTC